MSERFALKVGKPTLGAPTHRIIDNATGVEVRFWAYRNHQDTPADMREPERELAMIRSLVRRANKAT